MKKLTADLLLLLAAFIWGSTFVFQKIATEHINAFLFNTLRFLIAAGIMHCIHIIFIKCTNTTTKKRQTSTNIERPSSVLSKKNITHFFISKHGSSLSAGFLLALGINIQQVALHFTSVGKTSFLTGLYVVLVPVIGYFINHKISIMQWISVFIATGGLYFMSINGSFVLQFGDALLILSAVIWALYILLVSSISKYFDTLLFAKKQYMYCGLISLVFTLIYFLYENIINLKNIQSMLFDYMLSIQSIWWTILYSSIFSTVIGFSLQIYAQRHTPASHVTIIISLETVFGALFGALILNEIFSTQEYIGAIMIFIAMLLSQFVIMRTRRKANANKILNTPNI